MEVDPKLRSAVEKLKNGNDEAFNEVYQKTYNYVYFRAKQVMKNEDDAMDLMQIVYMEAYKSIKNLDKAESVYSWLSSITFRQGMKIFQKKKEILLDEDFENIFDSVETSDIDSRPELSLERKEQQRLLAELIDSLPEVQRATMVAFYYDNIKIEDIAEVMDCSVGTVKSRLSYARQALKKKLESAEKHGGMKGAGKMALTGALIFGAVQILSEETVLAAPAAAGVFANICSGLGIAATGAAVAGTTLAGGAGISAATGTVTGTTAAATGAAIAGTSAAGTAAAGAAAAAGTAASASAAGAAAAAGTAASAAGTAAAGAGAAKGLAVAVAVAVAGTGGTVGTTIYRSTVSSSDKVSSNEETGFDEVDILEGTGTEETLVSEAADETASTAEEASTIASPEKEGIENEGTESAEVEKEESDVKDSTVSSDTAPKAVAEDEDTEDDSDDYGMSKKLKKHIASAVASLFMAGSGVLYNGEVSNENLEAAYILENSLFKSKKEIKALSGNSVFLSQPKVLSSVSDGENIIVEGAFDVGRSDENGNIAYDNYAFVLRGNKLDNEGVFGHFNARDLSIDHIGGTKPALQENKDKDVKNNPSVNEIPVPDIETGKETPLIEYDLAEPVPMPEAITVSEGGS